jgi:hypothetical protein
MRGEEKREKEVEGGDRRVEERRAGNKVQT